MAFALSRRLLRLFVGFVIGSGLWMILFVLIEASKDAHEEAGALLLGTLFIACQFCGFHFARRR